MPAPALRELCAVFARHGNLTFGGGNAMIAELHREVVVKRGWVSQHAFDLVYALSRATPGTNVLAFSTAIGWMLRGWRGAMIALVGGSLPCALFVIAVTSLYDDWSRNPTAALAFRGAIVAAVGVMLIAGVTIIRPHWRSLSWAKVLVFVGGSAIASSFFSVSPIRILLVMSVAGYFWPAPKVDA